MSRSYARIACSIWDDDDDFMELSPGAQRTYLMLTSQKDVSACGSLPLTVRRWASRMRPRDRKSLPGWLSELQARRFVDIDETTEELLIRTFVKWDGGYTNDKRRRAIHAVSKALRSPALRRILAVEMRKLGLEPQFPAPEPVSAGEAPIDALSDAASDRASDAASDRRRFPVTTVDRSTGNREPQPGNREPGATCAGKPAPTHAPKSTRGSRIPDNFTITPDMRRWASEHTPGFNIDATTEKFVDWWRAKPGPHGMKLDWVATWRNWIREDFDRAPQRINGHAPPIRSTTDDRVSAALNVANRLRAREDAQTRMELNR